MKILFIGTDTKLFDRTSSVHDRFSGFASLADEVHVIIARPCSYRDVYQLAPNVFIHPTTLSGRLPALIKSFFVGQSILRGDKASQWIISVQDPFEQGWVGFLLSKTFKRPLHVQVHTDILSPFFVKNSLLNKVRVWGARVILRSAKRIRVDALRMKESIVQKYKIREERIDVLHIYVDVPKMLSVRSKKLVDGEYVLYVGRFEQEKNVESIIRGFARVSANLSEFSLVLLGSGSLMGNYKQLAEKLGVSQKLVIIPWSTDVGVYMREAKALVLASWFEGFALVLIEAVLNNCPIITTDVGAIGGIIPREYAHVFPQDNDLVLSQKIRYVIEHESLEKERVERAKQHVLSQIPSDLAAYTRLFKESLEKTLL